jgi:hypothetical protein
MLVDLGDIGDGDVFDDEELMSAESVKRGRIWNSGICWWILEGSGDKYHPLLL